MERVAILGPGGAGKTHVALALSRATGLPIVHLDRLFWRPGWILAREEESRPAVAEAVAADRWILDGNFLGLGADDPRFARADMRTPREARAYARSLSQHASQRGS